VRSSQPNRVKRTGQKDQGRTWVARQPLLLLSRRPQDVFRFCQSFHPPEDGGKSSPLSDAALPELIAAAASVAGHRKSKPCRRSQNQSEILAHETNRKLRRLSASTSVHTSPTAIRSSAPEFRETLAAGGVKPTIPGDIQLEPPPACDICSIANLILGNDMRTFR
jgi:hypothetical protein